MSYQVVNKVLPKMKPNIDFNEFIRNSPCKSVTSKKTKIFDSAHPKNISQSINALDVFTQTPSQKLSPPQKLRKFNQDNNYYYNPENINSLRQSFHHQKSDSQLKNGSFEILLNAYKEKSTECQQYKLEAALKEIELLKKQMEIKNSEIQILTFQIKSFQNTKDYIDNEKVLFQQAQLQNQVQQLANENEIKNLQLQQQREKIQSLQKEISKQSFQQRFETENFYSFRNNEQSGQKNNINLKTEQSTQNEIEGLKSKVQTLLKENSLLQERLNQRINYQQTPQKNQDNQKQSLGTTLKKKIENSNKFSLNNSLVYSIDNLSANHDFLNNMQRNQNNTYFQNSNTKSYQNTNLQKNPSQFYNLMNNPDINMKVREIWESRPNSPNRFKNYQNNQINYLK